MTQTDRILFFRKALTICIKFGRSPEAAIVVNGQPVTLRTILKVIGDGARLPRITEAEARALARETSHFSYEEILTGFSARRPAVPRGRAREGRGRRSMKMRQKGKTQC